MTATEKYTEAELLEIIDKVQRQADRLANRGTPIGINADDLFSAGQEAVVKALNTFDPEEKHKEIPIIAYALKASIRAMLTLLKIERQKKSKQRSIMAVNQDGEETLIYDDKNALDPSEVASAKDSLNVFQMQRADRNGVVTLTEVRAALPTAVETAKAVDRLREAIFGSIQVDDIREIMTSMVEKAKTGNVAAARLVLDQINGKSAPVTIKHIVTSDQNLAECG